MPEFHSGLVCLVCDLGIAACQCPDADDRMRAMAMTPGMDFAAKWCIACDHYWARCHCASPVYRLYVGGRQIDPARIRDILGQALTETHPEIGYDGDTPRA